QVREETLNRPVWLSGQMPSASPSLALGKINVDEIRPQAFSPRSLDRCLHGPEAFLYLCNLSSPRRHHGHPKVAVTESTVMGGLDKREESGPNIRTDLRQLSGDAL
ncbi:hypothetical protein NFI96_031971, partial [Prochilodus magdalenae]